MGDFSDDILEFFGDLEDFDLAADGFGFAALERRRLVVTDAETENGVDGGTKVKVSAVSAEAVILGMLVLVTSVPISVVTMEPPCAVAKAAGSVEAEVVLTGTGEAFAEERLRGGGGINSSNSERDLSRGGGGTNSGMNAGENDECAENCDEGRTDGRED